MSDLEDRLRAGLRAEAQRTQPQHLRELQVPARRRGGARRWLAPAAALVAVAVVATVIGVVAGDRHDSGPASLSPSASVSPGRSQPAPSVTPSSPSPSTTAPAAAMPSFYVAAGAGQSTRLMVRASATGAITADLTTLPDVPGVLADDRSPVVVGLVAAAAGDRTFVISFHRQQIAAGSQTITWFYRLTLNPDGTVSGLHRLPLTIQPGAGRYQAYAMALSPDGATLAVAVDVVPGDQARQPATGHASVEVVSLRTGAKRTWTAPASTELQNLSWVSGTTLGFSSGPAGLYGTTSYQVRTLDTAGPTGDLMSRSRRVALATPGPVESALLTDGGRIVVAFAVAPPGAVLADYSARTGRQLRVLATVPAGAQSGATGTVWSADPSGQHLLIGGFETTGLPSPPSGGYLPAAADGQYFGRVDDGRFTPLPDETALQPQAGVW
jgi:hypothetical protein